MSSKRKNKLRNVHTLYAEDGEAILKSPGNTNKNHKIAKSGQQNAPAIAFYMILLASLSVGVVTMFSTGISGVRFSNQRLFDYLLLYFALFMLGSVLSVALKFMIIPNRNSVADLLSTTVSIIATTSLLLIRYDDVILFASLTLTVTSLLLVLKPLLKHKYRYSGLSLYMSIGSTTLIGMAWLSVFYSNLEISTVTRALILSAIPFIVVSLPSQFIGMIETFDALCRDRWTRLRHPYSRKLKTKEAFVSLQVPTYNEPSDLVIETLRQISKVDYKNYEVVVIDNNTKDPKIWKPVQKECAKLGAKFKFFHKENVSGAKAGALNYVEQFCDPRTEIIGVIDADYKVSEDFLRDLIGHFEDKELGFIQTPHDYRSWRNNLFMRMCYWEYRAFFHTSMVALNEFEAGITVGTMCLIRKEAFDAAGGWSESCVTEDSELAIRIHDKGYSSIYVNHTYGRGLIPESFETYKKQRYRWTAGPVQELNTHHEHLIGLSVQHSKFNLIQRIFHLNHGLSHAILSFKLPLLLISLGLITSMVANREIIEVPSELWLVASISLASSVILQIVTYTKIVKASLLDLFLQTIASKALQHTISLASIRTLLTGEAKWTRTNKFKESQGLLGALKSTKEELTIALLLIVFTVLAYVNLPHSGLATMLMIGIIYVAIDYLAAPVMALIGVRASRE